MKRSSKGRKTPKTPGTTENLGRMTPGTDIGRGTLTTPGGVTIKPPTRAWKEPVQKNTRVPGNWPEKRSYRPRLVSRDVTRRMVHDPLDFLSSSGGEPRLRTAPMNPKHDHWDWRHTVLASRFNEKKHGTYREYFDRPRPPSSCGPARPGLRIPTPYERDPIHPLSHQAEEMPLSPSPLSPGCHGRGRLDRGSPDYMMDGTLSLSTLLHTPPDASAPRCESPQQIARSKATFPLPVFEQKMAWEPRWPGHAEATRVVSKKEDPFGQAETARPESMGAPPRCHPMPRSSSANASESASEMVRLNSQESGLLYWSASPCAEIRDLIPLDKWRKIQPNDILMDAINGTAPKIKPKVIPRRSLAHTAFTGL